MNIDKSVIGLTSEEYVVEVEKGHIKKFAEAIGDFNTLYHDEGFAKESIDGWIIGRPSFPVARTSEGVEIPLGRDMRRLFHGEQELMYERVIHVGDKLHCQMSVADLYEKEGKSGTMQFLVLDTEMKDENNKLVVTSRMNIIYRPAIS